MYYLFGKLFWYLCVALVIGFIVGWLSCGQTED